MASEVLGMPNYKNAHAEGIPTWGISPDELKVKSEASTSLFVALFKRIRVGSEGANADVIADAVSPLKVEMGTGGHVH